ncbi:MAG: type II toxin-antitoxin system HicA family toxin [Melioribacteraceae bacterium]
MPKKYPPLTYQEVVAILKAWGFKFKDQEGSHEQYEGVIKGKKRKVTVDSNDSPYDGFILKSMISQSGLSREEFYTTTKTTAKKINMKKVKPAKTIIDPID